MVRLGGAASPTYISVFRGLQAHFRRHGIELDWVLYSDYDALVEAFVKREIDLAWNAPLAYVRIKRRLEDPCYVVESGCGAVAVGWACLFPPLSSGGALVAQP
jgi:hypothetical protein